MAAANQYAAQGRPSERAMSGSRRVMPSESGLPRMLPEPAMTETNTGLGAFSDHSELFSSGPEMGPLTDTEAFSGGETFAAESTSLETEAKVKGRMTFPASRIIAAKRE